MSLNSDSFSSYRKLLSVTFVSSTISTLEGGTFDGFSLLNVDFNITVITTIETRAFIGNHGN